MNLLLVALALADDVSEVNVPVDPPPIVAEPVAPQPPAQSSGTPALRLAGFYERPIDGGKGLVEHRYSVVGASGPLTVSEVLALVGDPEVQARRKREVTMASIVGGVGLASAIASFAAHSVESVNNDPVLEPLTAVVGTLGFVTAVVGFGQPLQSNTRVWQYWTAEQLQPKIDAYNAVNSAPPTP